MGRGAASRLKRRAGRDGKDRAIDRLVNAFKRGGRLPERFLRSVQGQAVLRLLGRQNDRAVSNQLRRRGLSANQVEQLRQDLFVHLQRQVGRSINGAIEEARTVVALMLRDPGVRRGFAGYLSQLRGATARAQALKGLGIEDRAATALARARRCSDVALQSALQQAEADLQRLWTQATMTQQDPIRAASTFELFSKLSHKVRHEMGLPAGNGSFGSRALDAGLEAARSSRARLATYGTISSVAASIIATVVTGGSYGLAAALTLGATSSSTTAMLSGLPGLAKARHRRKLAETGEALGLADHGAAEAARRAEGTTQRRYGAGVAFSAVTGGAGSAATAQIGRATANDLAAPLISVAGAVSGEVAQQVVIPTLIK